VCCRGGDMAAILNAFKKNPWEWSRGLSRHAHSPWRLAARSVSASILHHI